jgi:hypothetical protein
VQRADHSGARHLICATVADDGRLEQALHIGWVGHFEHWQDRRLQLCWPAMESAMSLQNLQTSDPKAHTANLRSAINDLIEHMRRDVEQVNEPKAQALFETSAEVLQGLVTAFEHYEAGKEAWAHH